MRCVNEPTGSPANPTELAFEPIGWMDGLIVSFLESTGIFCHPVETAAEPFDIQAHPIGKSGQPVGKQIEPTGSIAEPVEYIAQPTDSAAQPVGSVDI